jgi:CheY-like chemotaxis protein
MTVVQGNLELMREDIDEGSDADAIELMDDALSAARDGSELAHRLLAFSRKQSLNPTRIDINELVGEFSRMVRRTVGQDIDLEIELGEGVAAVHADRSQLENALLNLCVNAGHAMPEGGTLSLETANRRIGHSGAADFPEVGPGEYVMITVSDTGTGMPPEILAQVFEPFFTTKEAGKGSGLGLSMVYGFANQSGGGIKIESEVGKGTEISILLPVAPADAIVQEESDEGGDLPRGSETVLVAEDEPRIRRFAARCLKDLGYQVLEAENATEALEVLKREPSVDLLFSDIVMPGGITGRELARTVSEAYPDLKVQLTTGFSKGAAGEIGEEDKRFPVLKKPYSKGQIARLIREVLDADE